MNICIALFKGEGEWHNAVVRRWTKSIYSHAELLLPDDTSITITPFNRAGITREPFDPEDEGDWDFVCIPINPMQLVKIENFYEQTKGQKYDWIGMIASQLLPYHIKHQKRWYCSEWIAYALRLAGVVDGLHAHCDMSPEVLSNLVAHREKIKLADRPPSTNWNAQKVRHFGPDDADR